jgi:hypothetical protein
MSLSLDAHTNCSLVGCKVTYCSGSDLKSLYVMKYDDIQRDNVVVELGKTPFFCNTADLLRSFKSHTIAKIEWDDPLLDHATIFDDGSKRKAKITADGRIKAALKLEEDAPIEEEVDVLPVRKRRRTRRQHTNMDAIEAFMCPITRERMEEPVLAADGITYEKRAIEEWFQRGNAKSPMTNQSIETTLTPNINLKQAIDAMTNDA